VLIAVLVEYAVVSLIAFITYGVDKGKSIERAWRVPEKVLLGMGLSNIVARANNLNGRVNISSDAKGFTVLVTLPKENT